jgi:hypothetical protein
MNAVARALASVALAIASALALPAQAQTSVTVGIVGWPIDRTDSLNALASEIENCLSARIREVAPEITVAPQRTVRDALYPLLEPATQPPDEASFAKLLAREEVRARLSTRGLRYLVAFTGGTRRDNWDGGILCGAGMGGGGCLGFMWRGEQTTLDAALWSIDSSAPVRREAARTEGTSVVPAFVLPIPLMAQTQTAACAELGARIAAAIRESAAGRAVVPTPRD